ncbi:MAG: methionine--tRNA ligase, partial [Spirochaetaceae bacterium]|nr:methionine--tRNA ligase [Spirochaetaceae bacterium]
PEKAASLIMNLCYVIKDLMILAHPYMPQFTEKVMSYFGKELASSLSHRPAKEGSLSWSDLGVCEGLETVQAPEIYFRTMDDKTIEGYRQRYAGSQAEREAGGKDGKKQKDSKAQSKKAAPKEPVKAADPVAHFNQHIALKTALIKKVERHPDADKLYVETLDDGSGAERVILSGLVPYLTPEQLLGKTVVIAHNLKPRKMRGIESQGMLLAADYTDDSGKECVEVLDCGWTRPGTPVVLEGADPAFQKPAEIDADTFFAVDIAVVDRTVTIGGVPLTAGGKVITTQHTVNGEVH